MSTQLVKGATTLLAPQLDYLLIDGSGSMQGNWWPMLAGLDEFTRSLQSANVNSHGIVSVFAGRDLQMIQRDSVIAEWPKFVDAPLGSTWGTTPLYDAIALMGRHMRALDPARASVVIVTDGEEMGSQHTDLHQARAIINWMEAKGWQITWLGCDFNNQKQARALGANERNTIGVRSAKLLEAGKALGDKRVRHAQTGTDISFSDDEKENFGGYLTHG